MPCPKLPADTPCGETHCPASGPGTELGPGPASPLPRDASLANTGLLPAETPNQQLPGQPLPFPAHRQVEKMHKQFSAESAGVRIAQPEVRDQSSSPTPSLPLSSSRSCPGVRGCHPPSPLSACVCLPACPTCAPDAGPEAPAGLADPLSGDPGPRVSLFIRQTQDPENAYGTGLSVKAQGVWESRLARAVPPSL